MFPFWEERWHDLKNPEEAVGEMLKRLYEPVLWKNLRASSWKVRMNSIKILGQAFPLNLRLDLEGADNETQKEQEALFESEYDYFKKALDDPEPEIRWDFFLDCSCFEV